MKGNLDIKYYYDNYNSLSKGMTFKGFEPKGNEFSDKTDKIFLSNESREKIVNWFMNNEYGKYKDKIVVTDLPFKHILIEHEDNSGFEESVFEVIVNDLIITFIVGVKVTDGKIIPIIKFNYSLDEKKEIGKIEFNKKFFLTITNDLKKANSYYLYYTMDKRVIEFAEVLFFSTTMYSLCNENVVEVEHKEVKNNSKKNSKKRKTRNTKLVRTIYKVTYRETKNDKRNYTKCEHEFSRRGCIVHYKNGKTGYRKPCIVNKGKERKAKTYIA